MVMTLPGGKPIGVVGTSVLEKIRDGKTIWEMNVRRHIGEENSGVSQVIVDKETNFPLLTRWDHTMMGKSNAVWNSDNLVITSTNKEGVSETKTVEFDPPAYSNDQWFFGFRQLPMKIGNKVTAPIRVAFTGGNAIDMEIEVAAKEEVETPVGKFDCFRLDTNIQQTFWITDTPQRYIARFEAGGVTALLTSIDDDQSVELTNEKLGFSVTVPSGWFYYERQTGNDMASGGYNLIAPDSLLSAAIKVRKKSMLDSDERESPGGWADSILRSVKNYSKDATERAGSRKEVTFAGEPGLTFVFDFDVSGRPMTAMPTLAFKGDKALELGIVGDASPFGKHEATFDAIRDSVKVK
jgi:hypothetical protein